MCMNDLQPQQSVGMQQRSVCKLGFELLFALGRLQKMLVTSIAAVADSTVMLPLTHA